MLQHRFFDIFTDFTVFMKKQITLIVGIAVAVLAVSVSACYYDNEEDLYGTTSCNTTDVKYSVEMLQIMETNCYSCHKEGGSGYAGISMDTYETLKDFATDGSLVDRITTSDATKLMPPNLRMSDCDIKKIQAWVNAGAPNN